MSQLEQEAKKAMESAVEHLKQELKSLKTGRANSSILDKVQVDVYGTSMRIKDLASVAVPEPRQILVTPYDASTIMSIRKGIEAANIGLNPMVDGKVIRINVPPMDESIRKTIAKQCKELGEKTKVVVREIRRKFNDMIKKMKSSSEITEDEVKKLEKAIQDLTDSYCKTIDQLSAEKEKEIMTV